MQRERNSLPNDFSMAQEVVGVRVAWTVRGPNCSDPAYLRRHGGRSHMILSFLVRWVLLATAVALTAWVMPDVSLEGGALAALWVAVLIALANVVVQVLVRFLPKPDSFALFAVLTLAVNGLLIWLVSAFTRYFSVDGFLPAVGAAILISIFSMVLAAIAGRLVPAAKTQA